MSTQASELPGSFSDIPIPSLGGYIPEAGSLQGITFWPRVGARLIDTGAHYAIRYASGYLFGMMLFVASGGHVPRLIIAKLRHPGLIYFVFALAGIVAYHVIFTTVHGSTLGKRLFSMVVVQEDGSPCQLKSAVVRELGYFIDALFFGVIGYTAMQNTDQQQRHGDEWAGTVVCKRSRITPQNLRGESRFVVALLFAFIADSALMMTALLLIIAR
jgi:uncharacterized RDD family membrane protein YckC